MYDLISIIRGAEPFSISVNGIPLEVTKTQEFKSKTQFGQKYGDQNCFSGILLISVIGSSLYKFTIRPQQRAHLGRPVLQTATKNKTCVRVFYNYRNEKLEKNENSVQIYKNTMDFLYTVYSKTYFLTKQQDIWATHANEDKIPNAKWLCHVDKSKTDSYQNGHK